MPLLLAASAAVRPSCQNVVLSDGERRRDTVSHSCRQILQPLLLINSDILRSDRL